MHAYFGFECLFFHSVMDIKDLQRFLRLDEVVWAGDMKPPSSSIPLVLRTLSRRKVTLWSCRSLGVK